MITITAAWTQRGWDSCDHLIDDSRLDEIIGQTYKTVAGARRAVEARADRRGYATFEFVNAADGRTYRYDTSAGAGIPGRNVPRIVEVG